MSQLETANLGKTFFASVLVIVVSFCALSAVSDAGRGFTTETLRRNQVAAAPRLLPNFAVIDALGQTAPLQQRWVQNSAQGLAQSSAVGPVQDHRIWIVAFMYTRCMTVCSALGSVYQQLQQRIIERGLQDRIGLLSISFDPEHDNAAALQNYAERLRIDPQIWQIVTLQNPRDRARLLDSFGIMVIPGLAGEYEHNAALHLVDAQGRLLHILDYDAPDQAIRSALTLQSSLRS